MASPLPRRRGSVQARLDQRSHRTRQRLQRSAARLQGLAGGVRYSFGIDAEYQRFGRLSLSTFRPPAENQHSRGNQRPRQYQTPVGISRRQGICLLRASDEQDVLGSLPGGVLGPGRQRVPVVGSSNRRWVLPAGVPQERAGRRKYISRFLRNSLRATSADAAERRL